MPDIIVNGCYASAKLPAIDNYVRRRVHSDNLNEKIKFIGYKKFLKIDYEIAALLGKEHDIIII